MKSKSNKTIHPLMKKPLAADNHPMFESNANLGIEIDESNIPIEVTPPNSGVWPVEPNILIEKATFSDNTLIVTLTNLFVEPISIIAMGVKYSARDDESIDFRDTNISLPPGESIVHIPSPRGRPYKFVVRTSNMTGTGCSRDNMNW